MGYKLHTWTMSWISVVHEHHSLPPSTTLHINFLKLTEQLPCGEIQPGNMGRSIVWEQFTVTTMHHIWTTNHFSWLERKATYLLPTWAQKITCRRFDWMLESSSGWKMMTGAFSQNVGKLFSELKLVTDNLFLYWCSSQLRSHWNTFHDVAIWCQGVLARAKRVVRDIQYSWSMTIYCMKASSCVDKPSY